MPILDASNPLLSPSLSSFYSIPLFFSCLSSRLVNSRQSITEEIRQNDYLFLLPFSTLFLLFFAIPFCAPFALKRGIKWPCISQEVGVHHGAASRRYERQGEEKVGQREGKKKRTKRLDRRRFSSWTLDIAFLRSPTDSFLLCICSYKGLALLTSSSFQSLFL